MIEQEHLKLIARLRFEPGYILLCDRMQAFVDSMGDGMAEDGIPSDERLQRVHEWRAARKLLDILKNDPVSLAAEEKPKNSPPEELTIDPLHLARLKRQVEEQADDLS